MEIVDTTYSSTIFPTHVNNLYSELFIYLLIVVSINTRSIQTDSKV